MQKASKEYINGYKLETDFSSITQKYLIYINDRHIHGTKNYNSSLNKYEQIKESLQTK